MRREGGAGGDVTGAQGQCNDMGLTEGAGLALELSCGSVCAEQRGRSVSSVCQEQPHVGSGSRGEQGARLQAWQELEARFQDGVG